MNTYITIDAWEGAVAYSLDELLHHEISDGTVTVTRVVRLNPELAIMHPLAQCAVFFRAYDAKSTMEGEYFVRVAARHVGHLEIPNGISEIKNHPYVAEAEPARNARRGS